MQYIVYDILDWPQAESGVKKVDLIATEGPMAIA